MAADYKLEDSADGQRDDLAIASDLLSGMYYAIKDSLIG